MAEVLQKELRQKAGVLKSKKSSLRVDLTPMVDLGFLLISFFIFTTSVSQPTVMKLAMPDDRNTDSSKISDKKTLNLILAADNKVYAYNGQQLNQIKNIGSNAIAMRTAINQTKNKIKNYYGSDTGMVVLIKPTPASTYADVVNALDEMLICNVKTYILTDANKAELNVAQ